MSDLEYDQEKAPYDNQHHSSRHRKLTQDEFYVMAAVPPELEWFANSINPKTRRAYKSA